MSERRDFSKEAAAWDAQPVRLQLAADVAVAVRAQAAPGPDADVLDFGCGTGLLGLLLRPERGTLTCLDTAPGMLAVVEGKVADQGLANVQTLCLDLEAGDALPGRYDLIASAMAFHHIRDVPAMVRRLAEALKPGGCLCIADLDPEGGRFHGDHTGVFHHGFERETLRAEFVAAGLGDVRYCDAAQVVKPGADGVPAAFGVFLMCGRRDPARL